MGEIGEMWREVKEEIREKRQKNQDRFIDNILPLLLQKYKITDKLDYFIIETGETKLHFFPKSNRLLFCKENRWINHGLSWIKRNLLTN